MGVNAVVIVENSKHISFAEFAKSLVSDKYGWFSLDDEKAPWIEFHWEGKHYFSWVFSPRIKYIGLDNDNKSQDHLTKIDTKNRYQITFLKVLLAVKKLAGGPVYVGNDVVNLRSPEDSNWSKIPFSLPQPLEISIPEWEEVEKVEVDKPGLVF